MKVSVEGVVECFVEMSEIYETRKISKFCNSSDVEGNFKICFTHVIVNVLIKYTVP